MWALGASVWAGYMLFTSAGDTPQEAVERKAGMHHDQHEAAGRYYVPTHAELEDNGTAVLRYQVGIMWNQVCQGPLQWLGGEEGTKDSRSSLR
ncbi:hypothetical protein ACH4NV_33790 [Streptomyces althioticus]|uniref:hypothetical protein n=1 Tax=Streptomyces althioticus TaxID=83380 RepID=UPI00379C510B